jgi:hypothetical protein
MFEFLKKRFNPSVSLESQFATLKECGIECATSSIEDALINSLPRGKIEQEPFSLLLCILGDEADEEKFAGPTGFPSENIWHFDTECIEDHGDYAQIANRLATLSQGDVAISNVRDFVDVESGIAWLSFQCNGVDYRWDAAVNNDWVDEQIFSRFAALLESTGSPRRYIHIDLQGQDCLIGCATSEQKDLLARKTGLKVTWLVAT